MNRALILSDSQMPIVQLVALDFSMFQLLYYHMQGQSSYLGL